MAAMVVPASLSGHHRKDTVLSELSQAQAGNDGTVRPPWWVESKTVRLTGAGCKPVVGGGEMGTLGSSRKPQRGRPPRSSEPTSRGRPDTRLVKEAYSRRDTCAQRGRHSLSA